MVQPRVTINHPLDGGQRGIVVNGRVNADPILSEVDTRDLFPCYGAPDMGSEGDDPWDGPQIATDPARNPNHLILCGAWLGHPVDEEISLLERGKERLS